MHENDVGVCSKILVRVDGSEASIEAAKYATRIATVYVSELIALYVILSDITIFGPETPAHVNMLKQQGQDVLDNLKEIFIYDRKVGIRSELIGSPSAV